MKTPLLIIILTGLLIVSCRKEQVEGPETNGKTIYDLQVPDQFNWRMSQAYVFHITGLPGQVIRISSADGSTLLHKSVISAGSSEADVRLSLPLVLREVRVNDQLITLTGTDLNVTLPSLKEALLTNYVLDFNGTSDYAEVGDPAGGGLDFGTGDFTLEAWVKTSDKSADTWARKIVGKGVYYGIYIDPATGTVMGYIDNISTLGSTTAIDDGNWHHVAFKRTGTTIKIYIDGVAERTETNAGFGASLGGSDPFHIGAMEIGASITSRWHGQIDEVRVWNVGRSSAEILASYNKIINPATPNLVCYWMMDEGAGTVTSDATASGFDATIHGASWTLFANGWDSDGDGINDFNDDYPLDATRAFDNFFPAASAGTLAFEDLWPSIGDYDFNDLVLGYRFKTVTNATNKVVEIIGTFTVRANGANLRNGFGFQLPDAAGVLPADIDVSGYSLTEGIITLNANHTETGQAKPTIIVFDNTFSLMPGFSNTQLGRPYVTPVNIEVGITVTGGSYEASDFSLDTWNPFIFIDLTRGREVHLLDYMPTDLATPALFGTGDDASDPGSDEYYKTATNLPWGLDFPGTFEYPIEYSIITYTYLHFAEWAESSGVLYPDWYTNTAAGYRDDSRIYLP